MRILVPYIFSSPLFRWSLSWIVAALCLYIAELNSTSALWGSLFIGSACLARIWQHASAQRGPQWHWHIGRYISHANLLIFSAAWLGLGVLTANFWTMCLLFLTILIIHVLEKRGSNPAELALGARPDSVLLPQLLPSNHLAGNDATDAGGIRFCILWGAVLTFTAYSIFTPFTSPSPKFFLIPWGLAAVVFSGHIAYSCMDASKHARYEK